VLVVALARARWTRDLLVQSQIRLDRVHGVLTRGDARLQAVPVAIAAGGDACRA